MFKIPQVAPEFRRQKKKNLVSSALLLIKGLVYLTKRKIDIMIKRFYEAISEMKQLFVLAKRTDFHVSLPVFGDINIKYDDSWSSDDGDEWHFWLEYNQRRMFTFGTIAQLHNLDNDKYSTDDLDDAYGALTNHLESCIQNLKCILPYKLFYHVLRWEEKIFYSSEACIVEIESKNLVTFNEAKQILKIGYQYLADMVTTRKVEATEENRLILAYFGTKQQSSCWLILYDRERNSFVTEINGNCVDEVEAPLLPVLLEVVEKQNYLTDGQLGMLKILTQSKKLE